jgi:sialic acid synthase SpsE
MGVGAAIASVALGARIIEKHFTLRRADGGVDSAFSIEPEELKTLVIESERAFLSLGDIKYGIQEAEKKSLQFKRSLYVVKDITKGEQFTNENVRVIRPGNGLPPKFYDNIIGKTASMSIKAGTPLSWDIL